MKALISTIVILTFCVSFGKAQSLIPEALVPTTYNESGDPLTNIIDMNGARQGNWHYQDMDGYPLLIEKYVDHQLVSTIYPSITSTVTNTSIVWQEVGESDPAVKAALAALLTAENITLKSDQQIVFIFNKKGELQELAALGNWDTATWEKLFIVFREFVENNTLNITNETFILL
jgi:hypothetical protein